jgi:hypothetical protein
VGL